MIGLEFAAALLLAAAGLAKLRQPGGVRSALTAARLPGASLLPPIVVNRLAGVVELLVAITVFAIGGRIGAALLVLTFGALAVVSTRMVAVERGQDCGCFGRPTPVTHWHTLVNLAAALIGAVGLVWPGDSLWSELAGAPVRGIAVVFGAALLAYLSFLMMTALPELLATVADLEATS